MKQGLEDKIFEAMGAKEKEKSAASEANKGVARLSFESGKAHEKVVLEGSARSSRK